MVESDYETSWTFRKPFHFWRLLNKQMDLSNLNSSKYKLVFFEAVPDDFNNCIDENGCLKASENGMTLVNPSKYQQVLFDMKCTYIDRGENGFRLAMDTNEITNISLNSPFYLKAIALVKLTGDDTGSNYVVAYSRLSTQNYCQNTISLLAGSEFVGHGSCKGGSI